MKLISWKTFRAGIGRRLPIIKVNDLAGIGIVESVRPSMRAAGYWVNEGSGYKQKPKDVATALLREVGEENIKGPAVYHHSLWRGQLGFQVTLYYKPLRP